ncbi:putative nucleotide-binding alpha-beta plait domain-containing protein [Rosa chinensis]|uniref:Putative nucleotide-binding alpha-beta plait domain-containing protein n=1 Tax=Rosa chinensis TaxID=74649 RepID=A0A2P6PLE9_ROSCH|nr:putative nucleotide-binding alpha-beta plait domain-containing protein [Rosa chinensis]
MYICYVTLWKFMVFFLSPSVDATNPGNNLYVTGLSTRVTSADVEKFFNKECKVLECHLVTDPRSRESRGFAFVTMETVEDAERCIKYLNRSVLEGRLVTVEKFLGIY